MSAWFCNRYRVDARKCVGIFYCFFRVRESTTFFICTCLYFNISF